MDSVNGLEYIWSPPQFDLSPTPSLESRFCLNNDAVTKVRPIENFVRTARWCPDGLMFLAQCEDRTFQLFNLPPPEKRLSKASDNPSSTYTFHQPAPILEFLWYPAASSLNPASFCFVASVRECPVKLIDAADGRLRASYRIVDHRERQIAPHSLTFNLSAEKLYCGFEDAIEVFDFARPGEGTRLMTTPSKKSKDGLKGIISALAFSPSQGSDFYAAGSLSPTPSNIAMFSESQGQDPLMFVSGGPRASVTQLCFNPAKPHIMYAAYRRHSAIYSWDVRSNVDAPVNIYHCRETTGRTNQRLRFDVDLGGCRLGVGDQRGNISMFDLTGEDVDGASSTFEDPADISPSLEFSAHGDAVGSVAFHPLRSILLSASGSRHFHPDDDCGQTEAPSSSDESDDEESLETRSTWTISRPRPVTLDASIKLWNFDKVDVPLVESDAATSQ